MLFHKSICAGASAMARDKIIEAIIAAFGTELGGKRAMIGTWVQIAKDYAAECAQDARETHYTTGIDAGGKGRVTGIPLAECE